MWASSDTLAMPPPATTAIGDPACLTNPDGTPTALDTDADHLLDSCEPGVGTTAGDADSDDDGVQDGIEYGAGTDPLLNTGNYTNPTADADGDGCNNNKELMAVGSGINYYPGSDRHPGNWWDFYSVDNDDIPGYDPNNNVDLSDVLDLLGHYGHQYNGGAYVDIHDQGYDRRRLLSPYPPGLLVEGNDGIDLSEALASLANWGFGGFGCVPPGPVPSEGGGIFN